MQSKMGEKNNIPQIRFKGFAENWKITKLNNISDIIGGGTPSTNVPEYWDGDIDWYSPTEIGDKVFATGSVKKITSLGLEKSSAKILPKRKTVLFTSRAGIGDMAILNKDGATNQGFQSLVLKNGIEPYFIYTAGHLIKKYALKHASGSTFLEVSGKQLGEMNLLIPTECEQSKIGTYFQNLDKLITLQQQKHDKLVTLKKAMLDKMFPKEGADVPEIRFKGFEGVWEEKKLGDVTHITTGKLDANAMKKDGKYDFYTSGIQKYKIDVYAFAGPAITIAGNGATVGYMHFANGLFNAYQRTYVLFDFTENREFLYFEISKVLPLKIKEEARSGNIPYIVLEMLTDLKIKTTFIKRTIPNRFLLP